MLAQGLRLPVIQAKRQGVIPAEPDLRTAGLGRVHRASGNGRRGQGGRIGVAGRVRIPYLSPHESKGFFQCPLFSL